MAYFSMSWPASIPFGFTGQQREGKFDWFSTWRMVGIQ
jgi:hypothetical protein